MGVLVLISIVGCIAISANWAFDFFSYHVKKSKGKEVTEDEKFAASWFVPLGYISAILWGIYILVFFDAF